MDKENFTWYESGAKKASHKCWVVSDGTYTRWYESGQISSESNYKNSKQHGVSRSWYESGQKESESSFMADEPYGVWSHWYENGQKSSEMKFITDNRIFSMVPTMKLYEIQWSEDGKETYKKIFFDENNLPKFMSLLAPQSVPGYGVSLRPQIKLKDKIKSWFS